MGVTSWAFLLLGSFAALGAAMAAGTIAALVRHRRTGTFPGSDEPVELDARRRALLWGRIVVGLTLAGAGAVALVRSGLV